MKTNEVVFILDKSGSMSNLVSDTIGGFNSILDEQKEKNDGEVLVSTVLLKETVETLTFTVAKVSVPEVSRISYDVRFPVFL